ncbi:MAG: hypothetical protein R6X18_15805 [Chloroflexota bacterium]|jgi:nucleoside-diphosphate-sugar epimerase
MVVGSSLPTGERVYLPGRGDHRHSFISEADVAKLILALIEDTTMYGRPVDLVGPAVFSGTQIVQAIKQRTGKSPAIHYQLPGLPEAHLLEEVAALINAYETNEDEPNSPLLAYNYGLRLTTLPEYIDRVFVHKAWPVKPGLDV